MAARSENTSETHGDGECADSKSVFDHQLLSLSSLSPPRPRQGQVRPQPHLLQRGGDPVVPASRRPAGIHRLLHLPGHVVGTDWTNHRRKENVLLLLSVLRLSISHRG